MRKLLRTSIRFRLSLQKDEQIMEEYNKKLEQAKKLPNTQLRALKITNIMNEMGLKLKQAKKESQLNKIKEYLLAGLKDNQTKQNDKQEQTKDKAKGYIPNNLIVKKLKFLDKKILLLGVEQQNQDHCIYVKRMAQKLRTKVILTALPPDMPYFIKTQLSFGEEWQKFIKNPDHSKQAKFYISPSPNVISDSCLGKTQMQLVRNNLNKSKQFNEIFYTILKYSKRHVRYLPNALFTPLLVNSVQKVYFCDYPILKQRQLWAMTIPINQMRDLFKVYHEEYHKDKEMIFDARILFPKDVISRKFAYMANAVKYASHQFDQPSIFVCPAQYAEMFGMQFKKDRAVTPYSDFSSPLNFNKTVTFIQFVQKLVIMDLILEPVIDKYFIRYVSFPYTTLQTVGGKENIGKIFMVWNHFHNLYKDALLKPPN